MTYADIGMVHPLHTPAIMMKPSWVVLSFSSLLLLGCQAGGQVKSSDGGSFMSLWNTYAHCQTESDLEKLKQDASLLQVAANRTLPQDGFVLPLPGKIQKLVTTPSARFAVDVKAMAASCSLKAGQTALQMGHTEAARSLLESVLEYRQPDYAYYSLQAQSMLLAIENPILQVSLHH